MVLDLPKRPPIKEPARPKAPPTRAPGTPPTAAPPAAPAPAEPRAVHLFKRKGVPPKAAVLRIITVKDGNIISDKINSINY